MTKDELIEWREFKRDIAVTVGLTLIILAQSFIIYQFNERIRTTEMQGNWLERMYYEALVKKPETCPLEKPYPDVCIPRTN